MSFKREESVLMRGNRRSRLLYNSGGTYRGRTNQRRRQCILGSAAHAPSQNGQPPRSWNSSASIPRRCSSKPRRTSLLMNRPKSGSKRAPTAKSVRLNKPPSTPVDMRSTSGCIPSSGTSCSPIFTTRSEEHTSELQSRLHLVCRLLLEKKKKNINTTIFFKKTKKNNDTE